MLVERFPPPGNSGNSERLKDEIVQTFHRMKFKVLCEFQLGHLHIYGFKTVYIYLFEKIHYDTICTYRTDKYTKLMTWIYIYIYI